MKCINEKMSDVELLEATKLNLAEMSVECTKDFWNFEEPSMLKYRAASVANTTAKGAYQAMRDRIRYHSTKVVDKSLKKITKKA